MFGYRLKKNIFYYLKASISLLLVVFLFSKIPLTNVKEVFLSMSYPTFFLGIAVFIFCWWINSRKWGILLKPVSFTEKTAKLFALNLISIFYACVLPGGQLTGETIKCYKITKDSSEKGKLVFSVIMDRLTGLVAIVFLGLVGILFTKSSFENELKISSLFIFFSAGCFSLLLFYSEKFIALVKTLAEGRKGRLSEFVLKLINIFFVYGGAYKTLALAMLYGLAFQFLNTVSVYLLARSIGLGVSMFDLFWINAVVSIVLVVPITVMGLGLREGSFVVLLGQLGFTSHISLSLSLLVSFVYLLVGLMGGVIELKNFLINKDAKAASGGDLIQS